MLSLSSAVIREPWVNPRVHALALLLSIGCKGRTRCGMRTQLAEYAGLHVTLASLNTRPLCHRTTSTTDLPVTIASIDTAHRSGQGIIRNIRAIQDARDLHSDTPCAYHSALRVFGRSLGTRPRVLYRAPHLLRASHKYIYCSLRPYICAVTMAFATPPGLRITAQYD